MIITLTLVHLALQLRARVNDIYERVINYNNETASPVYQINTKNIIFTRSKEFCVRIK